MNIRIDHYVHIASDPCLDRKLDQILRQLGVLMSGADDLNAKFDRMVAATGKIADDVRRLTESIGTGMTQAEVDAAVARGEQIASTLESLDAQTPDPPTT